MRRITVGAIPATALHLGDLVGRVEATLPDGGAEPRREARLFLAHLGSPRPCPARSRCSEPIEWVPHTEVAQVIASLGIPELGAFIEGYVDGWIPPGWITLGP
ncbi:hypothetical protein AC230_26700 [Streptomyces caatingaensis]|uniref:Uncharacterized protein n=1 Tax=Streptomyces caatingaensis TaxID=1678637 RepID=A0A0K9XAZ0_9ACTN|nr:hypothetical protein AC230_26700 [Streptomyces caatingaensis]